MNRERTFEVRETGAPPAFGSDPDLNRRLDNARQLRAEATAALVAATLRRLARPLRALPARWSRWRRQRRTGRALARCSDRVLADVGIERKDIPLIAKGIDPRALAVAPQGRPGALAKLLADPESLLELLRLPGTGPGERARAPERPRTSGRPEPTGRAGTLPLNLALQGGGAHGAFTWGVLERLLQAERFRYEGISGTSAGAINAVVFASGWLADGAAGAQANLAELWRRVAELAHPLQRSGIPRAALDATAQLLSPYQLNPLGINPLRELLERLVDFERLRSERSLKLFIAATNLRTGEARIFANRDLSAEAVLASACLPWLQQAVEIDGDAYWDGGYVSNPPLLSLIERCRTQDLLLVRINPSARSTLPRSAGEIRNRVGEIVFDQPLERELALLEARRDAPLALSPAQRRLARHRLHVIDGGDQLSALDPITKLVPDRSTLARVRGLGRTAAADWLGEPPEPADRPLAEDPEPTASAPGSERPRAALAAAS
jgi:NTE family protein